MKQLDSFLENATGEDIYLLLDVNLQSKSIITQLNEDQIQKVMDVMNVNSNNFQYVPFIQLLCLFSELNIKNQNWIDRVCNMIKTMIKEVEGIKSTRKEREYIEVCITLLQSEMIENKSLLDLLQ